MEPSTFITLLLQNEADLRAFIGSMVRDRAAREDVLQETALVLWREFERYDRSRPFGAWARGIAANLLKQHWEREARGPLYLPIEVLPAVLAAFERSDSRDLGDRQADRRAALEQCLTTLPDKSRELLTLRYERGLSLAQVAKTVGNTLDGVNKALSRIRYILQACVERRLKVAEEH